MTPTEFSNPYRAIALAGPTACGKTAAALAIAQHLKDRGGVEIISVDSALVYRGMDIGTAKPTAGELAAVPHHLIDIRDPLHAYSAADFVREATALMAAIRARGKLPLLVGGTMLYFKALFEGLDEMPRADPATRAALADQAAAQGWPALHAELARVDPATAARLAPQDAQRIARALEVWRVSGQTLSSLQTRTQPGHEPAGGVSPSLPVGHPLPLISLEPHNRAWLHARIAQRFDAMLASGLVDEVARLRTRADLHSDLPAMRCVGYRQAWEILEAHAAPTALRPAEWVKLRDLGLAATRQLAKRQLTWLRAMPQRQVVLCDAPDALAQVLQRVDQLLAAPNPPPPGV